MYTYRDKIMITAYGLASLQLPVKYLQLPPNLIACNWDPDMWYGIHLICSVQCQPSAVGTPNWYTTYIDKAGITQL